MLTFNAYDEALNTAKNTVMLDVLHLKKRYGDFCGVDNVSFQVRRGQLFAFLGNTQFDMLNKIARH